MMLNFEYEEVVGDDTTVLTVSCRGNVFVCSTRMVVSRVAQRQAPHILTKVQGHLERMLHSEVVRSGGVDRAAVYEGTRL